MPGRFKLKGEAMGYCMGTTGGLVWVCPASLKVHNCETIAELESKWPHRIPEDQRPAVLALVAAAYQKREAFSVRMQIMLADSFFHWVSTVARPVYQAGRFVGFAGVSTFLD